MFTDGKVRWRFRFLLFVLNLQVNVTMRLWILVALLGHVCLCMGDWVDKDGSLVEARVVVFSEWYGRQAGTRFDNVTIRTIDEGDIDTLCAYMDEYLDKGVIVEDGTLRAKYSESVLLMDRNNINYICPGRPFFEQIFLFPCLLLNTSGVIRASIYSGISVKSHPGDKFAEINGILSRAHREDCFVLDVPKSKNVLKLLPYGTKTDGNNLVIDENGWQMVMDQAWVRVLMHGVMPLLYFLIAGNAGMYLLIRYRKFRKLTHPVIWAILTINFVTMMYLTIYFIIEGYDVEGHFSDSFRDANRGIMFGFSVATDVLLVYLWKSILTAFQQMSVNVKVILILTTMFLVLGEVVGAILLTMYAGAALLNYAVSGYYLTVQMFTVTHSLRSVASVLKMLKITRGKNPDSVGEVIYDLQTRLIERLGKAMRISMISAAVSSAIVLLYSFLHAYWEDPHLHVWLNVVWISSKGLNVFAQNLCCAPPPKSEVVSKKTLIQVAPATSNTKFTTTAPSALS